MSSTIVDIHARQILDSRGNPTVEVNVRLEDGSFGRAAVPSGASTGADEAWELRDGDKSQFLGRGVLLAVENVNDRLSNELCGLDALDQAGVDNQMKALDGTPSKKSLGANAVLGVSMAVAHAAADYCGLPLFRYLGGAGARLLPAPMMNIINGGAHADNNVNVQEFMIFPLGFSCFRDAIRCGCEVFHNLKRCSRARATRPTSAMKADLAPNLKSNAEALDVIQEAVGEAGYEFGRQVYIALDVAANELFDETNKTYSLDKKPLKADELVDLLASWVDQYPIVSIEDGFGRGRLGRLEEAHRQARQADPVGRRRPLRDQHRAARAGDRRRAWPTASSSSPTRSARSPRPSSVSSWPAATATPASSATAAARRKTRRSPTWPWPWAPARSRPARPPAPTAWPSTTSS